MDAIQLLLVSVAIFVVGGFVSLMFNRMDRAARVTAGSVGALGSILGFAAGIVAAIEPDSSLSITTGLPFGQLILQLDRLSALMVGMISAVGFAVSLYSIPYLQQYSNRKPALIGLCINLFLALMLLVVAASNAFFFLIFWEMMTLVSYFLVSFDHQDEKVVRAGYVYFLIAHAGGALITLAFFMWFVATGSFDFATFRQAELSPAVRSLIFVFSFIGFGAKAGMIPLHIWMPSAYSASPTNASSLMASVMEKTAIYGIFRIGVDLLGPSISWWGLLVLLLGAASAVFGGMFALAERDLKRILAYSSVENVGIILLGLGTGMIAIAADQPIVAALGFLASLYHALNHSFFKALLFLGAGAVGYRLKTYNLNQMGGLARLMPWTGVSFLIGALAISAIPPLNGFVSEWFTFQAFLTGSNTGDLAARVLLPLSAALLALAGTLAAMVAIKIYGSAFAGPPRSEAAQKAVEVPGMMTTSMAFLAAGCILLGLGAPLIAPYLADVATQTFGIPSISVSDSLWVFPSLSSQGALSTPITAILILGMLALPAGLVALYGGAKIRSRVGGDPWACGYEYTQHMSITATSFDQPVNAAFSGVYSLREITKLPARSVAALGQRSQEAFARAEPVIERIISQPLMSCLNVAGKQLQRLQMGDIRMYCLYIVVTLALLLLIVFG